MAERPLNIVILSRGEGLYSTKRIVKAAEARGHRVQVLDHTNLYMVIEKDRPQIFHGDTEVTGIDAIIPRIGSSVTFYGSAVIRQFELQGVFTTVGSINLVRSRDKLRCIQYLSQNGVDVPKTAFAKYPGDTKHLIKQVGGAPLIIKILEGTQGLGVVLAESSKAARSVIEAFHGLNANILVQEFVKESKGADLRAFVVDGAVVGAMRRQGAEGEFRSNLHRGGTGVPVTLTPEEEAAAIKAAHTMKLPVAGVDMLQSGRGPLILEVNSSPGLEGIETATGGDIATKIIEYVERGVVAHRKKKGKGADRDQAD